MKPRPRPTCWAKSSDAIEGLARLDPAQAGLSETAQAIFESVSDLAQTLRSYLEGIEFNPRRLDQVEERLGMIHNLKRKFGDSIAEVLKFAENARRQLDQITHSAERLEELEDEQKVLLGRAGRARGKRFPSCGSEAAQTLEQVDRGRAWRPAHVGSALQGRFPTPARPVTGPSCRAASGWLTTPAGSSGSNS